MRHVSAALAAIAMSLSSAAGAQQATGSSPDPVLAAAASALGARNLKDLPSFRATQTGTAAGLPATSESYTDIAGGGAFAAYGKIGPFTTATGYDGRVAWTRDSTGVVWVDGSQQGRAAALNEAFRESYALWTPDHGGAAVTLSAPQSSGNRTYDVVRVTPPGSAIPFDVWIDRATHLPARYVETAAAVTTTTLVSDYRAVAGVQLPFANRASSSQGNASEFRATAVEIAPADLAAKIRKPESDVHDFSIVGASEASVPFDLIDNHVYLNVTLDGKGPFRFVFDTGGQNLIDPAVARAIGVAGTGSAQAGGVGATTETFAFAKVASLRIGGAEVRDQDFIVLPVRAGFGVSGNAPVDGLIGAEVLARFVTVFDYARKRVTFELPGAPSVGTKVPFLFSGMQPEVPCAIDRIEAQCTIDTGSRSSLDLLAPFIAANPSVVPAHATAPGVNGFGVGGADAGRLGRLRTLEIGGFELTNLIAGLSDATSGSFATPGIAANVGGGVLKRFTVTFDYPHQTMSLQPNDSFAAPDRYERSGIFLINQGKLVVAAVRPGTPAADAGIVKGDVVVSLDGVTGAALTLGAVREAFQRPSGTRLRLGLLGKGATALRAVTLTLRDYV